MFTACFLILSGTRLKYSKWLIHDPMKNTYSYSVLIFEFFLKNLHVIWKYTFTNKHQKKN